jgi:hypothetical protein
MIDDLFYGVTLIAVDAVDIAGNTPLSHAALGDHAAVVSVLVAAKADMDWPEPV